MKRIYYLFLLFFLSGCILVTDGSIPSTEYPSRTSQNKRSLAIQFDETFFSVCQNERCKRNLENDHRERFEKYITESDLFRWVSFDDTRTDYIIKVKRRYSRIDPNICQMGGPMITGFSLLLVPTYCEYPSENLEIEVINSKTAKSQSFIAYNGNVTMGWGAINIILLPFFASDIENLLDGQDFYKNIVLNIYNSINVIEGRELIKY